MMQYVILAASALVLAPAQSARATELQPGLWRITMKGGPSGMPATATTSCITAEQVKNPEKGFGEPPSPGASDCKRHDFRKIANGFTVRVQCGGQMPTETVMTATFESPQKYTMVFKSTATVSGRPMTTEMTMEGHRVGECPR